MKYLKRVLVLALGGAILLPAPWALGQGLLDTVEEMVEETVEQTVESTVEAEIEASIEDTVEASVEESVEASVEEGIESSVESSIESSVEEAVEASVEEGIEASVEEGIESSVEGSIEAAVEDAVEASVEAGVEASVEEGIESAVEGSIEAAVEGAIETSVEEGIEASVGEGIESSVEGNIEASVKESADLGLEETTEDAHIGTKETVARAIVVEAGVEAMAGDAVGHPALGIEHIVDEKGNPALAQEVLILVDAKQAAGLDLAGMPLASRTKLKGLGLVLLKLKLPVSEDAAATAQMLVARLGEAAVDLNHLYYKPASGEPGVAETTEAGKGMSPAEFAPPLGFKPPMKSRATVGLVDSAVDTSHPCLTQASIGQQSFVPDGASEAIDHGTAVASVLVAHEQCGVGGLLEGARLMNASVFFDTPTDVSVSSAESLVLALDWLVRKGVKVINMSLAGPANELVRKAIRRTSEKGVIVVAAVGNAGPAAPPQYPAAYPETIAVTAVDWERRIYRTAGRGEHVRFSAPGVGITVAAPMGLDVFSGTSMAAPFVTAMIVKALEAYPGEAAGDSLLACFGQNSLDLGSEGFDPVYGYGLIHWPGKTPDSSGGEIRCQAAPAGG